MTAFARREAPGLLTGSDASPRASAAIAAAVVTPPATAAAPSRGRVHEDIGEAVALALFRLYGEKNTHPLGLDSPYVRETLAARVIVELDAAGYVLTRKADA